MSFFTSVFFLRANPLIKKGQNEFIGPDDHITLPDFLKPENQNHENQIYDWSNAKSLFFSCIKYSKKLFASIIFFQAVATVFSLLTPIALNHVVSELQILTGLESQYWTLEKLKPLLVWAVLLSFCAVGNGVFIQHYFYRTIQFLQITSQIIEKKVYSHALKLTSTSRQKYQIGDIVNLMSSDAETVGNTAITTIDMVNAIVVVLVGSLTLFYYMGWSAMVALGLMIILGPTLQKVGRRFSHLEDAIMSSKDKRMSFLAQSMNAIRVIKYYAWEKSVQNQIASIRQKEIEARVKLIKEEVVWSLLFAAVSTVVLFSTLWVHYIRGQDINLPLIMTCLSLFSIMEGQFGSLSRFMSNFMNIFVSGKRITDFLKTDKVEDFVNKPKLIDSENSLNQKVIFQDVSFSFKDQPDLIKKITFDIHQGESVAIVGPVGAGKTTLLKLLLAEYDLNHGTISKPSRWSTAFVSQEPYIVNSTLKENIIFGHNTVSEIDIKNAIKLACLEPDLKLLPFGLDTEIGEKGVNLSGGQKQRVSLARAIISQSDLIVLDDPLSAVDVKTEDELASELLFGYWKNITRLVVTHRLKHLKKFDKIIFLNQGSYQLGTYDELYSQNSQFKDYLLLEEKNQNEELNIKMTDNQVQKPNDQEASSRITVDEDREKGVVSFSVFSSYALALGGDSKKKKMTLILLCLATLLMVYAPMLQQAWLTQSKNNVKYLIYGYGILGLFTLSITYWYTRFWAQQGIVAGQSFHDKALAAVLKAEIRFFDSTPVGRILQRFSRDVESVDAYLQWSFESTVRTFVQVITTFLLIILTLPVSVIILLPLLIYYYGLQNKYRRVAREVKRLDSVSRSPKFAHFKETLQGLDVIRAFKKEDWFLSEFYARMLKTAQANFNHYYLNRWFSVRLPIVGSIISLVTIFSVIFSVYKGWLGIGLSSLVILYTLDFWRHLNWGIRIFSDLESRMTSVERLNFYSELEAEKEFNQTDFIPENGQLEFNNVYLKYAPHLPDVLKGVTFKIKSGTKTGIIGRTGSGKSTLFQAVYRFVHFYEGDILLAGRSIRDYSLRNLRKSMSVIPQDPSLFMGSLRSNLDRENEKSDQEIFDVLDLVGLKDFVVNLPMGLRHEVTENGSNFSQGQRQLICLARALLVKVKIIFLDEATASVDVETDQKIQNVIQTQLQGITLVTIAHRLSTLKNYDQIIELSDGKVIDKV